VLLKSEANDLVIAKKGVIPAWSFRSDHEVRACCRPSLPSTL